MSEILGTNGSNNPTSNTLYSGDKQQTNNIYVPDYIDTIFQRLDAQDVERFYKSYLFWSLQPRLKTLHAEIEVIQQAIADNDTLMQQVQPSAIALASLAQLQANGVNDLNLLDRMLERGDTWLDHTMQLLERCEELDLIGGDYTQWCDHALDGAYDWIESMNATNTINTQENETETSEASLAISHNQQDIQEVTEAQLLQKLMSDEEPTGKIPALSLPLSETEPTESSLLPRKITQPLLEPEQDATQLSLPVRKITRPLLEPEQDATQLSLPARKITQPLLQPEQDATQPSLQPEQDATQPSIPARKITQPLLQVGTLAETEIPETPPIGDIAIVQFPLEIAATTTDEEPESIATPEEETDEGITQKMAVNHLRTVTTSKDADIQEVEEVKDAATVSTEDSRQAETESVKSIESLPQSEKPQIQKVQQRGFWHFLSRLIAFLLGR
jgi:hypothetical protein